MSTSLLALKMTDLKPKLKREAVRALQAGREPFGDEGVMPGALADCQDSISKIMIL